MSGRPWDSSILAQASSGLIRLGLLAQFMFDDATLYVTTLPFDKVWNGNTYLGLGYFAGLQQAEETVELKASNFTAKLTGVPVTQIGLALNENVQGRVATVLVAAFDSGWNIIGNPAQNVLVKGRMDVMKVAINAGSAEINVTIRNQLAAWDQANISRYTDDDQQLLFPGDKFFEFVPQMAQKELTWGVG